MTKSYRGRPGYHRGDTLLSVQHRWNECCQSIEVHRFDCSEVPEERRGAGPFGPLRPPTPAELIARLRSA